MQRDFDSPTRRIKTSDYYGQAANVQTYTRDNDLTTLSNFVKENMTSPIQSNFIISRHESRYVKGLRNDFKFNGELTSDVFKSTQEDLSSDNQAIQKFKKLEKQQYESPPNAAKISFEVQPVKALSLAMKKQQQKDSCNPIGAPLESNRSNVTKFKL